MDDLFFQRFLNREKEKSVKHSEVPLDVMQKYKGVFIAKGDEGFDIVQEIWKNDGFSSYQNSLFSLANPDEYTELARKFPSAPKTATVFARTGIGCLFLWDKEKFGDSIIYLNVHKDEISIVSTSFDVFFGVSIGADSFWKRECYGKIELKANKKFGRMNADECYTFVPALALGGSESVTKMEKVKIKENLELLSQLHSE